MPCMVENELQIYKLSEQVIDSEWRNGERPVLNTPHCHKTMTRRRKFEFRANWPDEPEHPKSVMLSHLAQI